MSANPPSASDNVGGRVILTCTAQTSGIVTSYTWTKGGNPLPGQTAQQLTLSPLKKDDQAAYTCVTSVSGFTDKTSNSVTVNVDCKYMCVFFTNCQKCWRNEVKVYSEMVLIYVMALSFYFPKWDHLSLDYSNFLVYKQLRNCNVVNYRQGYLV